MDTSSVLDRLRSAKYWIEGSRETKSYAQEMLHLGKARTEIRQVLAVIESRIRKVEGWID